MNINDIIKLIDKLDETSINELKICDNQFQLHLSKNKTNMINEQSPASVMISAVENTSPIIPSLNQAEESIKDSDTIIKSPLVGIYYESPSPDQKTFVTIGQKIKEGDVVCIIEAMKIFNEIKSPVSGIVKKVFPSNLEVIEYDQELIVIGEE